MFKINPVIIKGTVAGSCPKCSCAYTGQIDADEKEVILDCVNCGHRGEYFFHWPDELPQVLLRHKSNRQLISQVRIKKKKDPNQLPGQLAFKGFKEVL